ncbi:hypothetical protein OROHE_017347 [Orobanche hederae]
MRGPSPKQTAAAGKGVGTSNGGDGGSGGKAVGSKVVLKRGPWTAEEDEMLADCIRKEGEGRWRTLPKKAGLLRCGKSCRLRWMNYLRPSVKRGHITPDEEDLILRLHRLLGNRWSLIAGRIPGRTDNEIKNYWNTHLSKKLISQGIDPKTHKPFNINHNPPTINNINKQINYGPLIFDENVIINNGDIGIFMSYGGGGDHHEEYDHKKDSGGNCCDDHSAMSIINGDGDNIHDDDVINYCCPDETFSSFFNSLINDDMFNNNNNNQHDQELKQQHDDDDDDQQSSCLI